MCNLKFVQMVAPPTLCSNCGATYIIGKIIAKDNLNIENLMQTFEKSSSPKLLNKILRYCTNSPCECVILVGSNGGATYIICEIIAKDNLNSKLNANL